MNFVKQLTWLAAMGLALSANAALAGQQCTTVAPKTTPSSDFIDHGDGTVTHKTTGLMWKKCSEGLTGAECDQEIKDGSAKKVYKWQKIANNAARDTDFGIFKYIADVNTRKFASYDDWRLPNLKELTSIIEFSCSGPAINSKVFPNTFIEKADDDKNGYWVSTPYFMRDKSTMYVDFNNALTFGSNLNAKRHMRLVRSIK